MYSRQYFSENDPDKKEYIRTEILKNETNVLQDIKQIIKSYIVNNINKKSLNAQRKKYNNLDDSKFNPKHFQMNYVCLLDLKSVSRQNFDKQYEMFIQQKSQLPEIQAEILKNIKAFVESEKYIKAYDYVKNKYSIAGAVAADEEVLKKMRQIIYNKLKE